MGQHSLAFLGSFSVRKRRRQSSVKHKSKKKSRVDKKTKTELRWTEMVWSWRNMRPDITFEPCNHVFDLGSELDWAIALCKGHSALLKIEGSSRSPLTLQALLDGIDPRHIVLSSSRVHWLESLVPFMTGKGYVSEMIIHHRPLREDQVKNEEFESYIRFLLAKAPVVVTFDGFPSYSTFSGNGIYCPTDIEFLRIKYERFPRQFAVITGSGVELLRGSERREFWEVHASNGDDWGDCRLSRHNCLIREVVEWKV